MRVARRNRRPAQPALPYYVGIPIDIPVLQNDWDPDDPTWPYYDTLTLVAPQEPIDGATIELIDPNPGTNGDEFFRVTPLTTAATEISFTYYVTDQYGASSNLATVVIEILNRPPMAVDDEYWVLGNSTLDVDAAQGLLSNDFDPDFDLLTVQLVTYPTFGELSWDAGGGFTYQAQSDVIFDDSFTYTISDPRGLTSTATVVLKKRAVNIAADLNKDGVIDEADAPLEDVVNDQYPGLVIATNNSDVNNNAIVDFVDGFGFTPDYDAPLPADLFSTIQVSVGRVDPEADMLTISYSASDPNEVSRTLDQPFILPGGNIRLWTKPPTDLRNPASIAEGGDYIPPGTYSLSLLGLTSFSTITWYVEAVSPVGSVGGASITVTLSSTESLPSVGDFLPVTASEVQIERWNEEEEAWEQTYWFTSFDADMILDGDATPFRVRVVDPRQSGLTNFTLGGTVLALTQEGGGYVTEAFFVSSNTLVASLPVIAAGDILLPWSYNPPGMKKVAGEVQKALTDADKLVAREVSDAINAMKSANWTPPNPSDSGAFGKEVHRRVGTALANQQAWLVDVLVEQNTNKIVQIGAASGQAGHVQVDLVKLKAGYTPQVGDILDHTKIEDIFDVKATINGNLTQLQLDSLKGVRSGWTTTDVRVKTVNGPYRWSGGFTLNKVYNAVVKTFVLLGAAKVSMELAALYSGEYDDEIQQMIFSAQRAQQEVDPDSRNLEVLYWESRHLKPFLAKFMSEDTANLVVGQAMYIAIANIDN